MRLLAGHRVLGTLTGTGGPVTAVDPDSQVAIALKQDAWNQIYLYIYVYSAVPRRQELAASAQNRRRPTQEAWNIHVLCQVLDVL